MTELFSFEKLCKGYFMKHISCISIYCVFLSILSIFGCASKTSSRMTLDFNKDWLFMKGEQGENAARVGFDDSGWEVVRLPHDWAIAGPFDPAGDGSTGKLPWKGIGWYRKAFTLDAVYTGRRVYFDFDGVMAFPSVYINGQIAADCQLLTVDFLLNRKERKVSAEFAKLSLLRAFF